MNRQVFPPAVSFFTQRLFHFHPVSLFAFYSHYGNKERGCGCSLWCSAGGEGSGRGGLWDVYPEPVRTMQRRHLQPGVSVVSHRKLDVVVESTTGIRAPGFVLCFLLAEGQPIRKERLKLAVTQHLQRGCSLVAARPNKS